VDWKEEVVGTVLAGTYVQVSTVSTLDYKVRTEDSTVISHVGTSRKDSTFYMTYGGGTRQ
jgi:hypothetical protein